MSPYQNQNGLIKQIHWSEQQLITSIRTSKGSYLNWKKHFHKNPSYIRIYADFEADNEIDFSCVGNKRTNFYKQNPLCNAYYIVSELDDVLKSGYYEFSLGYIIDWFIEEVLKVEKKMAVYFKTLKISSYNWRRCPTL